MISAHGRCTNGATKFFVFTLNICGSTVWKLLLVTLLASRTPICLPLAAAAVLAVVVVPILVMVVVVVVVVIVVVVVVLVVVSVVVAKVVVVVVIVVVVVVAVVVVVDNNRRASRIFMCIAYGHNALENHTRRFTR